MKIRALVAALACVGMIGCEGGSDAEMVGTATIALTSAPSDATCIKIAAAGTRTVTRSFDVAAADSTANMSLTGLPVGSVVFSGQAFAATCSAVTEATVANWVAAPVTANVAGAPPVVVTLTFRRNGQAIVAADFVEDTGAGGSSGFAVAAGGYVTSGAIKGYAYVAKSGTGTTATPADFNSLAAGGALTISGTVAGLSDYSGLAAIGVNLNEVGTVVGTYTPTGTGLDVQFTRTTGSSPLRVSIQTPAGNSDATQRWCANVTASGVIPWTSFNTTCWSTGGVAYARQPISTMMLMVPGTTTAIPYNITLNSIADR